MKQKIHIPHSLIDKLPHWLIFFFLCSFFSNAQQTQQPYEWEWAMNGGSSLGGLSDEAIHDIKVGTDSNYYFIASIFGTGQHNNAQLDGLTVPTNNTPSGPEDIFLFSTDCEGQVRWSQAIGGGSQDMAFNLVLDSEDNVYIGGRFNQGVTNASGTFPVRFSPTDSLPSSGSSNVVSDYHKRIFLVKYDKDGNYQGKKALQGDVDSSNRAAQILDLAISNDTIHFIVGLQNGTHLDNHVTVPNTVSAHQYYLAKYDTDLNYVSSMPLPIPDGTGFSMRDTRFIYDDNINTYYIAGERIGSPLVPLTYDGQAIVNRSFIIAFKGNDGSKKWIREIYSDPGTSSNLSGNKISSVAIDDNSNVYVAGSRFRHPTYLDLKIYDPANPSVTTYNITTGADFTVPMAVKFNSDGDVQWVQATAAFSTGVVAPGLRHGIGIAINNNEVALGAQASAEFWDNIEIVRPTTNYQPDPILVRIDKQTGNVIDVHGIEGEAMGSKRMTAVAADNDGNYITAGTFNVEIFKNNNLVGPLYTTGEADFFVAKLANSECGSGLSTDDFNALSFNVYPNPTTGIINVETTEQLSAYTIYDATGRKVRERMFDGSNQINLENTSNGVYFIRIVTVEGNAGTVKVVKR
ncbi:T9SS type A sorting domain-containing protein [Avrilella dinanensis]|uniref:Secretion system C-terminal sorting domain-containing protein n=1 Tax=Avrilella dinanensis TaxID=2008672 RepID=A0A2M9R319_9FLAO|nr:T9SS type A sorting domain-containing protein [Avrilella dinanensis]PJR03123.1 hypothetical protein CDL10_00385 [Avrilella dinanensis]